MLENNLLRQGTEEIDLRLRSPQQWLDTLYQRWHVEQIAVLMEAASLLSFGRVLLGPSARPWCGVINFNLSTIDD